MLDPLQKTLKTALPTAGAHVQSPSAHVRSRIPPLRALTAFEAAARNLSFQKAAAELNVTPSAISQQIRVLEDFLGIALFRRLNRRMLLTEAGEIYFDSVKSAFSLVSTTTARMTGDLNKKILMVRSSPSFAVKYLMPRLPHFLDRHPSIQIRIDASNEKTDFAHEAVDLEIRFGAGDTRGLYVEALPPEPIVPLVSPRLRETYSLDSPASLLAGVPLIHSVKCPLGWDEWFASFNIPTTPALPGVRFDRSFMAIDAAVSGMGVALDSETLAREELLSGQLVVPFACKDKPLRQLLWFVCPFQKLDRDAVACFREWLFETFTVITERPRRRTSVPSLSLSAPPDPFHRPRHPPR